MDATMTATTSTSVIQRAVDRSYATPITNTRTRRNAYFARPPTKTKRIAFRKSQSRVAMNAPTNGTTGATRFSRMTRSSLTRRNWVQRRIARSSGLGIRFPRTRRRRTARYRKLVPTRSPATAMARRRPAHETGSRPGGRNEEVRTIHASGRAGNAAASTAKMRKSARTLPSGPREAKRPARNSSRVAIGRPSEETADVHHRHREEEGPADDLAVGVQGVRSGFRVHVREDERHHAIRRLLGDPMGHRRIEEMALEDDALAPVRRVVDAHDLGVPEPVRPRNLSRNRTVRDRDDAPRDAHERVPLPERVRDVHPRDGLGLIPNEELRLVHR